MLAGEILLLVMTFMLPFAFFVVGIFYGLEIFVGAIQAFVFGMLTLVFAVAGRLPATATNTPKEKRTNGTSPRRVTRGTSRYEGGEMDISSLATAARQISDDGMRYIGAGFVMGFGSLGPGARHRLARLEGDGGARPQPGGAAGDPDEHDSGHRVRRSRRDLRLVVAVMIGFVF